MILMAGGQAADAYQDYTCTSQHAPERQASDSTQSNCPLNHTCCHGHAHPIGALTEAPAFTLPVLTSNQFHDGSEAAIEGPVLEIDYPPQLS